MPGDFWSGEPVQYSADIHRIEALPRREQPTEVVLDLLVRQVTARYRRQVTVCRCADYGRDCITTLRPIQAWALYEIALVGGLLGPIGVGHGKTMLDILASLAVPGITTSLLLIPAKLVTQFCKEYEVVRQHFRVPGLVVHGYSFERTMYAPPMLHVLSYERLSVETSTTFLDKLNPDLVIFDEAHKLRHYRAVRTGRVRLFMGSHRATRSLSWSGSITDSSIRDFAHLSGWALRENSPVPLEYTAIQDWARALDAVDFPAPMGALSRFCRPGEKVRDGFHRRLVETRGVIATSDPSVDVGLEILERPLTAIPQIVRTALRDLETHWRRPDGEEFSDALGKSRCARELACGFYYRWIFTGGETDADILEWLSARKEWKQELREKLKFPKPHLDSPKLCAQAARRAHGQLSNEHGLPEWNSETWMRWHAAKPLVNGGKPPETEPVRLHEYLAADAAKWATEHRGIVWYDKVAFGTWVSEIGGLPMHGGGSQAGQRIDAERGDRSIVASIKSHGEGRDGLQRKFAEQLVANPPSSPTGWEQLLGRLHRIGQTASSVRAYYYRHTEDLACHVDTALQRALYVDSTLGTMQKLRVGFL